MKLTVVGCSGSGPGPESPASCYLVEAPYQGGRFRLLLDLGSGALGYLQRHVDPFDIDAVALSHLHADHCLDLTAMYVHRKYHPHPPPRPRVQLYGPSGTGVRLARAYAADEPAGLDDVFEVTEWRQNGTERIGPFSVTPVRVAHPVQTYALRIEEAGRALVFSGDTGPCDALVELADGAEMLLAEASFLESGDNEPDLHLTGRQAAEHATRAGAGRLLLTHVPPWHSPTDVLAEARPAYAGPLEVVTPGAAYEV